MCWCLLLKTSTRSFLQISKSRSFVGKKRLSLHAGNHFLLPSLPTHGSRLTAHGSRLSLPLHSPSRLPLPHQSLSRLQSLTRRLIRATNDNAIRRRHSEVDLYWQQGSTATDSQPTQFPSTHSESLLGHLCNPPIVMRHGYHGFCLVSLYLLIEYFIWCGKKSHSPLIFKNYSLYHVSLLVRIVG